MKSITRELPPGSWSKRPWLLAVVALVLTAGCGKPAAYEALPFTPAEEFSDSRGHWQRSETEPTATDNQRIGAFFRKRPELIGSPDWTGQPEKYVSDKSKSLVRFYWFSGNDENPSWNALEMDGTRTSELDGKGMPGTEATGE